MAASVLVIRDILSVSGMSECVDGRQGISVEKHCEMLCRLGVYAGSNDGHEFCMKGGTVVREVPSLTYVICYEGNPCSVSVSVQRSICVV